MSAALINRSLTTIRTELEFLRDSEVITEELYESLNRSLPNKYDKAQGAWGIEKQGGSDGASKAPASGPDAIADSLASTSIVPPAHPPLAQAKALGYCKALYDYNPQEQEDIHLKKDDKIAVVEHLSEDWWKGYKQGSSPSEAGVFPSNYVRVISAQEFELTTGGSSRSSASVIPTPPADEKNEKVGYVPQSHSSSPVPPPPQYEAYTQSPQGPGSAALAPQPSYGGYAQYPPPSTNYYPPQQYTSQQYAQPQQVVEQSPQGAPQHGGNGHLRKFGGKLGNAAIFGAGATIGSDLVNSIF
ncbi:Piso0_000672 [Millerozyma farinosa CBS 7064]|uniref:Piso0_000672 protein n=1 Tax=Pichia sorbitophila (strain ATCC MYA-4447 / BCRC 22081 / CBS 7064 / NBRC 10061 / NRRL Y-12695) TaxID=559304 RepID=G8YR72_PICSO|nr:Piso0_000672 [Millerozyma farinosa CBS 7064]